MSLSTGSKPIFAISNFCWVQVRSANGAAMAKSHHILGAASNLLGISLLIIAGLHISNRAAQTFTDEIGWGAALCFSVSCLLSYLSLRSNRWEARLERIADSIFMIGLAFLLLSVVVLAFIKAG